MTPIFSNAYRNYFLSASKDRIFKYEDFFNKPNDVLKQMCEILKLNIPMNIQKIWKYYANWQQEGIELMKYLKKVLRLI